jgi:maleylacetoacetate isomerase
MKLFGYYRSSASYRIRILLNLKGIDYEYVAVLLNKGEQKHADFLARNPSGLVPVLDTGEQSLGQSLAIAEYLEERYPEPALLPADPAGRARVREMLATVACDIHPLQNLRVLNYLRQQFSADDDAVSHWIARWISNGFNALEQLVARADNDGRHCHGDTLSFADAWLVPQMYNARRFGVDVSGFPLLNAIDAHCRELPAFAAAAPELQPDAPAG